MRLTRVSVCSLVVSCAWWAVGLFPSASQAATTVKLNAVVLFPSASQAATTVKLNAVVAKAKPTSLVTFRGVRGGQKVAVQRRVGASWRLIAAGRTGEHGKFALTHVRCMGRPLGGGADGQDAQPSGASAVGLL